jgi:hypothetical protein
MKTSTIFIFASLLGVYDNEDRIQVPTFYGLSE